MSSPTILTVAPADAGQKLTQFLSRVLEGDVPRSALMRWIRTGQVRVDGHRAGPFDRLQAGQAVRLPPFALLRGQGPALEQAHALDLPVLAETDDFLVIAKPAGLPVHPGSGWTDSVQTRLQAAFLIRGFAPTIAHRLDKNTSGVLLAAKTFGALALAHEAFRTGEAVKEYLAWVVGEFSLCPLGQSVELRDRLSKTGPQGAEKVRSGQGKEARLKASPLRVQQGRTLLRIRLFTGRTHQIRAQLSERGFPIAGDAKYGGGSGPMLLHAWKLTLDQICFTCPPPWPEHLGLEECEAASQPPAD